MASLIQDRVRLIKHIKQFSSGKKAVLLMKKTIDAVALYEEIRTKGRYDAYDTFKRRVLVGAHIRQSHNQRRLIRDFQPKLKRGRPSKPEVRVLISLLATAFEVAGIGHVTQNQRGQLPLSRFEAFAFPLLTACQVFDKHGWVTKHIADRDKT